MNQEITEIEPSLDEYEDIIADGQETFVKVGNALTAIRDKKLYLRNYKTFEDYCQQRWGWSRDRGYQLMSSAAAVEALPEECRQIVGTEGKARAIAKVPPEKAKEVLDEAAKNGKMTAKAIETAAAKIVPPKSNGHPPEPEIRRDSTGFVIPQHRWFLFDRAPEIQVLLKKLSEVRCAVKKYQEEDDVILKGVSQSVVISEIDSAYYDLSQAIPYAVCPNCQGETFEQCRTCHKRGYISKHVYDNAIPSDLKSVRDTVCVK